MEECLSIIRSLKDSAADSKLKLLKEGEIPGVEKPGGEKRIHLGSINQEQEYDDFFFPDGSTSVSIKVLKIDLIKYLCSAKDEFFNPKQKYRLNIASFYNDLLKQTLDIFSDIITVNFLKNVDTKRYYISPRGDYKYVVQICLPLVTDYHFLRIKRSFSYDFYLIPEFKGENAEYTQISENNSPRKEVLPESIKSYFPIIRTKPFLLLAGISGTGKSRVVKEMAFASCPDKGDLHKDKIAPGNYLLVEVKPNWHDSTELLGYESGIKDTYVLTPFIKFLYKAMRYPSVPFFVCLDEMNLAPVEQYFAEFLSVLESRKQIDEDTIESEPLIKKSIFKKYELEQELLRDEEEPEEYKTSDPAVSYSSEYEELRENGLRIPQNVIVVGTVNMDETTHQFSRKVIDRAMTIEMNEVNFDDFFESNKELHYFSSPIAADKFICKYASASQAMAAFEEDEVAAIKENVPAALKELNSKLENTPFKVAYRVQNEIILYLAALKEEKKDEGQEYEIGNLINKAFDDIMLMKVLPRIEGDSELLRKPLDDLYDWAQKYKRSSIKIKEMKDRLDSGSNFTSFWP